MKDRNEDGLAGIVHENIHTLLNLRKAQEEKRTWEERMADAITRFAGSMRFVYLHVFLYGGWFVVNLGWIPGVEPFDPFPFVMLAMEASVEAIFLSTFVLISQNRMGRLNERRADLDLQISLLSEHEVTRLITMTDLISKHLGVGDHRIPEVEELKKDVPPELVIQTMEKVEAEDKGRKGKAS